MAFNGILALGNSKKYTNDTVVGMGAIKGASCTVKDYEFDPVTGDTIITFAWFDSTDVEHTEEAVVKRGIQGEPGVSITSITKTGTAGLIDTYTILYSDGTSTTFNVTNGSDGGDSKLDVDQGVENAGKFMKVGADGKLAPAASSEGVEIDDTTISSGKVWSSQKTNQKIASMIEEAFSVDFIKCVDVNPVADVFTDPKVIFNTTSEKFYSLKMESRSFKKYTNDNEETIFVFDLVDGADVYSARIDGRIRPARTKLIQEDDYFIYHYTDSGTTIEEYFYTEDYVENVNAFYGYWEELEIGGVEVINNLTSTSTTDALSANMGKALDEGKADKSTTYTKTEIDALIGDVETLLADL